MSAKKKAAAQPSKLQQSLEFLLMLQSPETGDCDIKVGSLTLVFGSRNPGVLSILIDEGRFGAVGPMLRTMILRSYDKVIDHDFRTVVSDGHGWALLSVAREGVCKLAILGFQRGPVPFSAEDKSKMLQVLELCRPLVEKILSEEIAIAKQEAAQESTAAAE